MNHPKREEWVPFICGEADRPTRRELKRHLKDCPECRTQITAWNLSLRRLDRWKLRRPVHLESLLPVVRWAPATALILGLGFIVGRFSAAGSLEQLRANLEPQLRETLRQEVAQMVHNEVTRSASATLAAAGSHAEQLLAAYDTIPEARRAEDLQRLYVALKKQLDILAINTQQEFVQLAGYKSPVIQ